MRKDPKFRYDTYAGKLWFLYTVHLFLVTFTPTLYDQRLNPDTDIISLLIPGQYRLTFT